MATRVLVTGVSGFVGGALGAQLRRAGYRVTGVSRRPPREGSADEWIGADLAAAGGAGWGEQGVVVHAAAMASPWGRPSAFVDHNVTATRRVLEEARRAGCRRFVFLSSSSVLYRHGDQWDLSETTPLPERPINAYAATKRAAEELVRASGLPAVVLRPRAVFGPGDTVLFPRLLRAARKGVLPRFTRPDGAAPRGDLIYIDTLTEYIQRAMESDIEGTFNLTNAEPVDLYGFLGRIFAALGYPPLRRTVPVGAAFPLARAMEWASGLTGYWEPPITRFGVEVMAYSKTFDPRRSVAAFGAPAVGVEEGLRRFIDWQRTVPV